MSRNMPSCSAQRAVLAAAASWQTRSRSARRAGNAVKNSNMRNGKSHSHAVCGFWQGALPCAARGAQDYNSCHMWQV